MTSSVSQFVIDNQKLPKPLETRTEFLNWLQDNKDDIDARIESEGAVLFRHFPLKNAEDFQEALNVLRGSDSFFSYTGGTSPRTLVLKNIFTSTNMPFFSAIPFHSEMVYQKTFPKKVVFFCHQASWLGGCTPFSDNQKVYTDLYEPLMLKEKPKTLIYFRRLKNSTPLRKFLGRFYPLILTQTWQTLFSTEDPKKAEDFFRNSKIDFEWQKDFSLLLRTELPRGIEASSQHKGTWLNSAHFFQLHRRIWGWIPTAIFRFYKMILREPYDNAVWKDGTPLTSKDIHLILKSFEKNSYRSRWQQGDLLVLNNLRMSHGRDPYLGRRKIWVGLIGSQQAT